MASNLSPSTSVSQTATSLPYPARQAVSSIQGDSIFSVVFDITYTVCVLEPLRVAHPDVNVYAIHYDTYLVGPPPPYPPRPIYALRTLALHAPEMFVAIPAEDLREDIFLVPNTSNLSFNPSYPPEETALFPFQGAA